MFDRKYYVTIWFYFLNIPIFQNLHLGVNFNTLNCCSIFHVDGIISMFALIIWYLCSCWWYDIYVCVYGTISMFVLMVWYLCSCWWYDIYVCSWRSGVWCNDAKASVSVWQQFCSSREWQSAAGDLGSFSGSWTCQQVPGEMSRLQGGDFDTCFYSVLKNRIILCWVDLRDCDKSFHK